MNLGKPRGILFLLILYTCGASAQVQINRSLKPTWADSSVSSLVAKFRAGGMVAVSLLRESEGAVALIDPEFLNNKKLTPDEREIVRTKLQQLWENNIGIQGGIYKAVPDQRALMNLSRTAKLQKWKGG